MVSFDEIHRDERGAVLLAGVFMAAFLVGVLWYVIGLGDAAIYREQMQDGADAAAYAAAVYQARGMNIIAMINLVMAAVLAVLVALKIAQMLLVAANVASCLLSVLAPGLVPVCAATSEAKVPMVELTDTVETVVDYVLRGLYVTESAVALGMPYVAEEKSILVATSHESVQGGLMASVSLIPGHLMKWLGDIGSSFDGNVEPKQPSKVVCKDGWISSCACDKPRKNGCCSHHSGVSDNKCMNARDARPVDKSAAPGNGGENPNAGIRWGLPVEDDDFTFLCGKAGKNVVDLVFLPFERISPLNEFIAPIRGLVEHIVHALVTTLPGHFCGDGGVNLHGAVNGMASSLCDEARKRVDEANKNLPDGEEPKTFDDAACQEQLVDQVNPDRLFGAKEAGLKVTKMVYSDAQNGDNYFASWAFVWGDLRERSDAQKGVAIAAWGKVNPAESSVWSQYHFAQSEYYYEPEEGGPTDWGSLAEGAMWNMRWRARLRRTHPPPIHLAALPKEFVSGTIASEEAMKTIWDPVEKLEDRIDGWIGDKFGRASQGIIH
ncbi:hypothetical protein ACMHYB_44030 [Sorangium sp. So ce1128]